MTVQISEVAFEAEISGLPDSIHALKGVASDSGVKFVDFTYDGAGDTVHRMRGLQIAAARTALGSELTFGLDHGKLSLASDAFIMRGPGHEGSVAWSGGYRARVVNLAPNLVERLLRTPLSQVAISPVVDDLANHGNVHHLLAALSESGFEAAEDPLLLESVALAIMRAAGVHSREATRKAPALTQAQAAVLYDLIAARLTEPLSLGDMAEAVGLSESYFVRAFTGSFGVTPYRYVLRERVALAERLIQSGGLSLSEVAALSGFPDANRMSRTFRQMTGRSPTGVFRRKPPKPA